MSLLRKHIEDISDDFQSTFAVINDTTITNMMGSHEFETVTNIIKKYCGNVDVKFVKNNTFEDDYDIYTIFVREIK